MVKRLLRKYKYPPEGMEDVIQTVVHQAESWVNTESSKSGNYHQIIENNELMMVAENNNID